MANALAASSSPYLRQHADNPVDWQPWSQDALDRAAAEAKPLLISIGYAACHWCHVMAHESFEDPAVAEVMNEHFVCIKVDREERPDLDAIYMDACQILTGHGGWPLHAFATPDGRPFWSGTYFPPEPGRGMPAWTQVLLAVAEAWRERRDELEEQGTRLAGDVIGAANLEPGDMPPPQLIDAAVDNLSHTFDAVNGGFGGAPKFPPHTALELLLRRRDLSIARYTLTSMASGGIFDQLAGGFSRYAVDETWTVPHFEKMLYDNALLAARYAEAASITGRADFGHIAQRTLDWVLADLGDADGGFASALDADAAGIEGSTYVWTPGELEAALGEDDAAVAAEWFGVTPEGNFEHGATVLEARGETPEPELRDRIIAGLLAARAKRPQPARDGKRVVSWNALTILALVASGLHLERDDHLDAAIRCADLIERTATGQDGRLLRLIPLPGEDSSQIPAGVLDDHAHLLEAYLALHEATLDVRWYAAAERLARVLLRDFQDPQRGGFFATGSGHEQLVARRKELEDAPIPSGQGSAALGLLRLHALSGDRRHLEAAEGVLKLGTHLATRHPRAFSKLLVALDQYHRTPLEIAIVGDGAEAIELLSAARDAAPPHAVISGAPATTDSPPLLAGRTPVDGAPAAYVCEAMTCRQPVTTVEELRAALSA